MQKIIRLCLFTVSFLTLFGGAKAPSPQISKAPLAVENVKPINPDLEDQEKEYAYLNRQIESLSNLQDYYRSKAVRFRNRADRYQYQNGGANYPEAKKLWREADEYDSIADKIQVELKDLEKQRTTLIKKMSSG